MSLEVKPLGVECNLGCLYCYQHPARESQKSEQTVKTHNRFLNTNRDDTGDHNAHRRNGYDMILMKNELAKRDHFFTLFGGEPLLMPEKDLEELFAFGYEKNKESVIQTNGSLINERHIQMFQKYNVSVGISIDGPGELNDARIARNEKPGESKKTRAMTAKTEAAIERLCGEKIPPGLIVTLHKKNATKKRLPLLCAWLEKLETMGVSSVRLHTMDAPSSSLRETLALTGEETIRAYMTLLQLQKKLLKLKFDIFHDIVSLLTGTGKDITCVWNGCDPYTTISVDGIGGHGESFNCGRTDFEGVNFLKSENPGYERSIALYYTPQMYGGCKGCRFFLFCKGYCPGSGLEGDWRNRSDQCELWKAIFSHVENRITEEGDLPLSKSPRLKETEERLIVSWILTASPSFESLAKQLRAPAPETSGLTLKINNMLGEIDQKSGEPFFKMHEFQRMRWVSQSAKENWQDRIATIRESLAGLKEKPAHKDFFETPSCCAAKNNLTEFEVLGAKTNVATVGYLWSKIIPEMFSNLPCKAGCPKHIRKTKEIFSALEKTRHHEAAWLREMLSWSVEWSALHGIAEIKTPVFTMIHDTKVVFQKRVIRHRGKAVPKEGATGSAFPFDRKVSYEH